MGPRRGRRSGEPQKSALTPPTPGGCTICTATFTSGAGIGTTAGFRAVLTPTYIPQSLRRRRVNTGIFPGHAEEAVGLTTAGPSERPLDYVSNRNGVTTTSVSALSPSGRSRRDVRRRLTIYQAESGERVSSISRCALDTRSQERGCDLLACVDHSRSNISCHDPL